jgi:hypothetical protein
LPASAIVTETFCSDAFFIASLAAFLAKEAMFLSLINCGDIFFGFGKVVKLLWLL